MNKKKLAIAAISVVFVLAAGFGAYKQIYPKTQSFLESLNQKKSEMPNTLNSADENNGGENEIKKTPDDGANLQGIEVDAIVKKGLIICADECGNGVCQSEKPDCTGLNCVCQETPQDCPQDCEK